MSTEKDCGATPSLNTEKCAVVLVDVAGTSTSINFVKDTLFPFATKQAEEYLKTNWDEESVKKAVKSLNETTDLDVAAAAKTFSELTEKNSDNEGVKALQGLIYKKGYEAGELKAHVFSDVAAALESWGKKCKVAVYSTGSVESQKLLFSHTAEGDLSSHIHKYFDQGVGKKTEGKSYEKIAEELAVKPEEIVFITDNVEEAKAAKSTGVSTALIKREGNEEISEEHSKEFPVISSFKDVNLDSTVKRKLEEEPVESEVPPAKIAKTDEAKAEEPKTEAAPVEVAEEAMEVDAAPENLTKPEEETKEPTAPAVEPKSEDKTEATDKTETEEKKPEETPMEATETVEAEKTETSEEKPTPVEEPAPTKTEQEPEPAKSEPEVTKPEPSEKQTEEVVAEAKDEKEETKPEEVKEKVEETDEAKVKEGESNEENGEKKAEVEEKENKSELANGIENGKTESENGVEDNKEKVNGDAVASKEEESKSEETEIKVVKKLEETDSTPPVSTTA